MKILIFTQFSQNESVFLLRLGFYLEALKKAGRIECFVLNSVDDLKSSDLVIFHRYYPFNQSLFDALTLFPKPVIYEDDDLLFHLPGHIAGGSRLFRSQMNVFWECLKPFLSGISVSTNYLKQFFAGESDQVTVILNTLPKNLQLFAKKREVEAVRIGFMGTTTHEKDFSFICETLVDLKRQYGKKLEYHFFGFVPQQLSVRIQEFVHHPYEKDFIKALKRTQSVGLDIGLAPLINNTFNRAKSAVKFIEYTSFGAVGIYSNVIPYRGITSSPVLKNDPSLWRQELTGLIERVEHRAEVFAAARSEVERCYSFPNELDKYDDFLHRISNRSHKVTSDTVYFSLWQKMNHSYSQSQPYEFVVSTKLSADWILQCPSLLEETRQRLSNLREGNIDLALMHAELCLKFHSLGSKDRSLVRLARFALRLRANISPNREEFVYRIASLCQGVEVYTTAKTLFFRLAKGATQKALRAGSFFHLGEIALAGKNCEEAKELFKQCIHIIPKHKKAQKYLKNISSNIYV